MGFGRYRFPGIWTFEVPCRGTETTGHKVRPESMPARREKGPQDVGVTKFATQYNLSKLNYA